jgi:rod shape-determining protein MreC
MELKELSMTRFQSRTIMMIVLVLASVALLGFNQFGPLQPVRSALLIPLSMVQKWVAGVWGGASSFFQRSPDVATLQQRNAELEAEIARLQTQIVTLEEDQADLRILSGLLTYARTQPDNRYLAASVIGLDPSPFLRYIILDRGSDVGVISGMPVVTDRGLVGRVVEVTGSTAKVQLIVDSSSAVNARLQNSRERGVVVGKVAGGLEIQNIAQQVVVEPGERVLTSGLGGKYPPDILIGTVSAVRRLDYEVLQNADITPAVDFNRLEIVLIITNFTPGDIRPFLQNTPTPPAPVP